MGQAVRQLEAAAPPSVTVRELGEADREAMLAMYRGFDPLGAAQGLPPVSEHGRREWISNMLADAVNFGAFDENDRFIGHVILAESGPAEMEVAFFVHQSFRRRRVGTKLLSQAVAHASSQGARRLWASVTSDNVASLRLLRGQGFKASLFTVPTLELELLFEQRTSEKESVSPGQTSEPGQRHRPAGIGSRSGASDVVRESDSSDPEPL